MMKSTRRKAKKTSPLIIADQKFLLLAMATTIALFYLGSLLSLGNMHSPVNSVSGSLFPPVNLLSLIVGVICLSEIVCGVVTYMRTKKINVLVDWVIVALSTGSIFWLLSTVLGS